MRTRLGDNPWFLGENNENVRIGSVVAIPSGQGQSSATRWPIGIHGIDCDRMRQGRT
jgi:hypothetical protein